MVTTLATIGDIEADLDLALGDILAEYLPQTAGFSPHVAIYEDGRKKRRDASRESWRPGSGEIRIKFGGAINRPHSQADTRPDEQKPESSARETGPLGDSGTPLSRLADLIKSLDRAEQRPGFEFVALKWFRDLCLPGEEYAWAESSRARDEVLRTAISDGVVLTSKVPNPKAPAFPVTAIRLNRQHPQVKANLGDHAPINSAFQPVSIEGEELSQTVLRERR